MSQAQLNLVKSKHHIRLKERLRIVTHLIKHVGKVEQSELMLRYQNQNHVSVTDWWRSIQSSSMLFSVYFAK